MPSRNEAAAAQVAAVPSMLDLVRLSTRRLFPPGGIELYRQIALLTGMSPDHEVLGVACGKGVSLGHFVKEYGVMASGVDVDPKMVEQAEAWSRQEGIADRLQFQTGRSDALPYRDSIFDLTIGEIGLANHCAPLEAVRELVRVTKPEGFVVLVQLVWKAPVDEARREVLSEHLGAKPMMVVEWKRILREAGVEDVHTEDWSDEETSFRAMAARPFPDFAELFSLPERLAILRRARRRWGWRGVASAINRENEVHKLLTSERILGLDLLRGRKAAPAPDRPREEPAETPAEGARPPEPTPERVGASVSAPPGRADGPDEPHEDEETSGLPLFGRDGEAS